VEEFRDTRHAGVGAEAGEEGFDDAGAAGRSDAAGEEQSLGGGGRGGLGFLLVEVTGGLVGEEHAPGLAACHWQ
jgi:hypothetical protein